jgi:hypothetical protein
MTSTAIVNNFWLLPLVDINPLFEGLIYKG